MKPHTSIRKQGLHPLAIESFNFGSMHYIVSCRNIHLFCSSTHVVVSPLFVLPSACICCLYQGVMSRLLRLYCKYMMTTSRCRAILICKFLGYLCNTEAMIERDVTKHIELNRARHTHKEMGENGSAKSSLKLSKQVSNSVHNVPKNRKREIQPRT